MPHIDHLAIWTSDIERLRAFYELYFAAQAGPKYVNAARQFESYFLTFAGGARLELMQRPNLEAPPAEAAWRGYVHLAISLGSKDAVDAMTQRLQQDGYFRLDGPRMTGDGYYESVLLDPDGNHLELTI